MSWNGPGYVDLQEDAGFGGADVQEIAERLKRYFQNLDKTAIGSY